MYALILCTILPLTYEQHIQSFLRIAFNFGFLEMETHEFAEKQVKALPDKDSHEQRIWLKWRFGHFLSYYSQTVTLSIVPTWQLQDKRLAKFSQVKCVLSTNKDQSLRLDKASTRG